MSKFKRCPSSVEHLAIQLFNKYDENAALSNIKIDYLFAYGDRDDVTLALTSHAIVKNGRVVQGQCRKTSLKERALGHGDAEVMLDGDWWETANPDQQAALLDHELHHIVVTEKTDDCERPIIKLRDHDFEVGWFRVIAERHGRNSGECAQAAKVMVEHGQAFWPDIVDYQGETVASGRSSRLELDSPLKGTTVTLKTGGKEVTVTGEQFSRAAKTAKDRASA